MQKSECCKNTATIVKFIKRRWEKLFKLHSFWTSVVFLFLLTQWTFNVDQYLFDAPEYSFLFLSFSDYSQNIFRVIDETVYIYPKIMTSCFSCASQYFECFVLSSVSLHFFSSRMCVYARVMTCFVLLCIMYCIRKYIKKKKSNQRYVYTKRPTGNTTIIGNIYFWLLFS